MNNYAHVWKAVEEFRRQYIPELHLPVDIFSVVELQLKLNIIPFLALSREYGVDAALTEASAEDPTHPPARKSIANDEVLYGCLPYRGQRVFG